MTRSRKTPLSWKRWILCSTAITGLGLLALAPWQTVRAQVQPADAAQADAAFAELVPDPALVTGRLDNGVRYAILPNATPPGQGALRVQFDAGSLAETEGTEGLAHYLEHMAFNGSENVPEGEMIQMLERLGLSFGADTNASTGLERTTYKLNLPKTTDDILDAAFMLMRETASGLTLDQGAIDRELGIILSEKRTRDTAAYRGWEARMRFFAPGSDVMDRLPIGTEEAIRSIRSDDFREFYEANYHPEKTSVVFVGDADPADIEARIRETFGDWRGKTDAAPKGLASPADIEPARIGIHAEEGVLPQVVLATMRPYVDRPDTAETRRERTLRGLAFGMLNQRLRALSEQSDRPFISATAGSNATLDLTEGAIIQAQIRPEDWRQSLNGIETELRRALLHGFDPAEFDAQIRRYEASYEAQAAGADTRPTTARMGGLVDSLMNSVAEDIVFTHPVQNLARWNALKDTLTLDQVEAAFRERWGDPEDLSVFLQLPDADGITQADVREVLDASRAVPVAAPDPIVQAEFAYTDHGKPGRIVSDNYLEDVDARLVRFDNNVALTVKRTDYQDDRVNINVQFGDGNLSAPYKSEGLRRMSLTIMKESGLEAHSPEELRRLMAGRLVLTNAFTNRVDEDRFAFMVQTVPEDMRTQLDVFAAQLSAQAFSEDARRNHIDKLKAWYPRHDTTVEGVAGREIARLIHGDDRFGFTSEEEFYTPTLAEIESWLRPQLESGPIQVTVVGDMDPDVVVQAVAETLGALPLRRPVNAPASELVDSRRAVAFPDGGGEPVIFRHRGDDNQAQLRLYWPAGDGMDPAYARRLSVLRAILRNRLVKDIREGEATTYSPGAGASASTVFDDFGYLFAVMSLKPEDVARMSDLVRRIAGELGRGTISQDELDRALEPVIRKLDSTEQTNPYWMNVLSDAHEDGRGLRSHRTRRGDYAAIDLTEMRRLAVEIFDADKILEVRILPTDDAGAPESDAALD
ncbi:pitrilysin family protein [uncultured Algimonas sp.]|uniref:M16 family metallopeptidase n=1 Tax=uncultured Algimonas sp. TaxID=1547920 RepID=UPI00260CA5FD|nr:insulinase family protein [uncultured Algimonas sp.]